MYTLYEMKNIRTDKYYIGATKNYEDRKKQHIRYLSGEYHHNKLMQQEFETPQDIQFIVLQEYASLEEAHEDEIRTISDYRNIYGRDNVYNLNDGGFNLNKGYMESEYAKRVASEVHSKLTGELNSFYGRKHTEESRLKMSESKKGMRKGIKFTDSHKQKMSENNAKNIGVNVRGKVYRSFTHASRELGECRKAIARRARDPENTEYELTLI